MEEIFKTQFLLTGYLEYLINSHFRKSSPTAKCDALQDGPSNGQTGGDMPTVDIITPSDPYQRGSQLSVMFSVPLSCVQVELQKRGIVCDIRMPNVMRIAPAPLYNSYTDVYNFVVALRDVCSELDGKFEETEIEETSEGLLAGDGDSGHESESLDSPLTPSSSTSSNQGLSSSDSEPDSLIGTNTL
jgi:hypothetical protein